MKNTEQEQKTKVHSKLIKAAFLKSLPVILCWEAFWAQ